MTLPLSGALSLNDIQGEFGGSNPININEYYRGGAYVPDTAANSGIPTSGTISIGDFYGGDVTPPTPTGTFSAANFTTQTNRNLSTYYYSNNLTLSVTNGPITVTVTGLASPLIQKNSTGTLASSLSFNDGDTCRIRGLSASSYSTSRTWTASMNGDSASFTVTTKADPGGTTTCLASDSPIFIYGSNLDETVADLVVGDEVNAFHSPTMIDESNPEWEGWTADDISDGSNLKTTITAADSFIVGQYVLINGQLKCTQPHPFLAERDSVWQWIRGSDLVVGDNLYGINGSSIPVTSVEEITGELEVMNVGAETVDTYYAGKIDGVYILNHNK
jgi:hypothetical protein